LAKQSRAFKSEKRKKELIRLKKQEEKRQRRFKRDKDSTSETEIEQAVDSTQEAITR
jgi:hypothetical protein